MENGNAPIRDETHANETYSIIENPLITTQADVRKVYFIGVNSETQAIFTTNMLQSIDDDTPDVVRAVAINNNNSNDGPVRLNDVRRKTAPTLNIERERRMAKLAWYFLFPDGKIWRAKRYPHNTSRNLPRIMGSDKRFQGTYYLVFALSIVEYFRAKSSVLVSCRM